jgi:hypothetical protein
MVTSTSHQSYLEKANPYPYQAEQNLEQSPHTKGKLEARSVLLLSDLVKYTGIVALVTAIGSLFLCQDDDSNTKEFRLGYCLGSCYVLAEMTLIMAAVGYVALQIFFRMRS